MFPLSYVMSALLAFSMLVSVMSAGLLNVTSVVGAHSAILLTSFNQSNTYCNLVVIV